MREICEEIGSWEDGECKVEDLNEKEIKALHEMQLGIENIRRADGALNEMHHLTGRGMDHFSDAIKLFEETNQVEAANKLKESLGDDAVDNMWTYEIQEKWTDGFFNDITEVESEVRSDIAGDRRHVNERLQKISTD